MGRPIALDTLPAPVALIVAALCTPVRAESVELSLSPEQTAAVQLVYLGNAKGEFKQAVNQRAVDGSLHAKQRAETGAGTPSIGIAQR